MFWNLVYFFHICKRYGVNSLLWLLAHSNFDRKFFIIHYCLTKIRFNEKEIAPEEIRFQMASSAARMAKDMYENGEAVHYEELKPNYMRKAEAERKLEEKSKTC